MPSLLTIVAAALAATSSCAWAQQDKKINVLFLAVDDLRVQLGVDRVPGTPAMSTPNIDSLVGKSLFLRKAQVQQAVCSPTRTSILTSRYPDTTRVWDLYSYFRTVGGNLTTIPELFKLHGYHSVGGGKIFHPGHASGADSGNPSAKGDDSPYSWNTPAFHAPNLGYWSGKRRQPGCDGCGNSWIAVSPEAERKMPLPGTQIADFAVESLSNFSANGLGRIDRPDSQPFFLAVGFHKPHLPFVSPERFFRSYPEDDISLPGDQDPPTDMPPVAWSNWGELRAYLDIAPLGNSGQPGDHLPANVTKSLRRAYYAAVSFTDYNIGRIINALDDHGYTNDTVISFWGDHGWQLGEHGEWCKHTNFDLATNAPMFLHVPGKTDAGIVSSVPTEYLDLMPTLVEAAMPGVVVPECPSDANKARQIQLCTHGTSLMPLIDEPNTPIKRAAYSQYPRGYVKPGHEDRWLAEAHHDMNNIGVGPSACLSRKCTMGYSMLTHVANSEYRYTEWVDFNTNHPGAPDWNRIVGKELYNHSIDPLENRNIAGSADKDLLSSLSSLLRNHPVAGIAE